MDTKKLTDELDEKLFSDKIFKKIYVFYAFWIILAPVVNTIFSIIGVEFIVMFQVMLVSTLFAITKFFELIFNFKKINLKNKTITSYLLMALFLWFLISIVVNGTYNINLFLGICYFLCFSMILNIDKRILKLLAIVFVCEIVLCSILGLIDLKNQFIPGFLDNEYVMSMQFRNPNWSAFIVIIAEVLCLWFIYDLKKNWQKSLCFIGFVVMTIGLFVGGSYAPETALFLCELALLIYLWLKNKKCPWLVFSAFLSTIAISFLVWLVPIFREVSTARANYFYESLAVIDSKLGTELAKGFSTFFNKLFGTGIIDKVEGADGWGRADFTSLSINEIFSSAKNFIFGTGCGFIYSGVRVHNVFLVIFMEFGIVGILLFLSAIAMIIVRFIKINKTEIVVFLFAIFLMCLFDSLFCCIEPYYFPYFVMFVAALYKIMFSENLKKPEENNEKLSQK